MQFNLSGIRSPFGRRGGFSPAILFAGGEPGVWYDPSDLTTLFTDTAGTTPVTTAGQTVALMLDKSGNDLHATQATAAARPSYIVGADGTFIQHDLVDDALTVTLPVMGTEATVAYVTRSEVRLLEDQTISGSYTLPTQEIAGFVAIDRALTIVEKVKLIRYLASKVEGVNYGAEIDRLTLIAINAVDVFVYDTSKDSDGGAWRSGALAQASSWYNETLNTATRGSRKEFPAVAVIVAEASKVTIYDGDDPALPMWMVFTAGNNHSIFTLTINTISMSNGILVSGGPTYGMSIIDFLSDAVWFVGSTSSGIFSNNISNRNSTSATLYSDKYGTIVNNTVNDVAMTVLPDAPIDAATGLPVPTIAVATAGGVSVITDSGAVYDSTSTSAHTQVDFFGEYLFYSNTVSGTFTEIVNASNITGDGWTALKQYGFSQPPFLTGVSSFSSGGLIQPLSETSFVQKATTNKGISVVGEIDYTTPSVSGSAKDVVAYITSTYNTGWMNGSIKGAFLSDTDDTDLVGGTDNDRSVNANPLTVNGTITRSPVATGADLVAYSGFSASNYLEQPYNSDLDFGTGDFCVMGWAITNGSGGLLERGEVGSTQNRISLDYNLNNFRLLTEATGSTVVLSSGVLASGGWQFITALRRNGTTEIYVDGVLKASAANVLDVTNTSGVLRVGQKAVVSSPHNGSLALWRISTTAPTAEQIAKIYNDEKVLFQENAQATLYGASDAVTALAHDPDTDLLHVGTSAGRSVFEGLRRVGNTTTSVSKAISASGGLIVEK